MAVEQVAGDLVAKESRHNEFNDVQCSLKRSSRPLRRCRSCQISGAEIWLVLNGISPYGPSAS